MTSFYYIIEFATSFPSYVNIVHIFVRSANVLLRLKYKKDIIIIGLQFLKFNNCYYEC